MNKRNQIIKNIDSAIFVFLILFLGSLTNSIFVNQIGYYFALLFILIKWKITNENPFRKNGLELIFVLFIAAELISATLSQNYAQAFQNVLKRFLVIPLVYTIAYSANSEKRAKLFFEIYIGFALASCLIYIYMAYDYWIYNQFAITQSGPSVFQFPITAGELISFVIIFLFAFSINEKGNLKFKLFNIVGFLIATFALISTYKRTGWIGTGAGLFTVLILKKQWKIIGLGIVCVIILFISEKNVSEYIHYTFDSNEVKYIKTLKTDGRAFNVFSENDTVVVSDYNNGLLLFYKDTLVKKIETPAAVIKFVKWKENFYLANQTDSRFLLYKKEKNWKLKLVDEFVSPGYVNNFEITNGYLYVNDADSGLTVFKNPLQLSNYSRYSKLNSNEKMRVDSSRIYYYSKVNGIKIYKLNDYLPSEEIFSQKLKSNNSIVDFENNRIFISGESGLSVFDYSNNKLEKVYQNNKLKNVYKIENSKNKYLMASFNDKIFIVEKNTFAIQSELKTPYLPSNITLDGTNIFVSVDKQGRLKSMYDPYKPSNFVRFALWRAGWKMFKNHPIFGVGDIDLANLYRKYKRNFDKEIQGHMHNNFVHLLVILGSFGFIIVMFMFWKIFTLNFKIYSSLKNIPFASSFALGTIGGYVAFLVAGLTEWNFGDHEIITMLWFAIGLNIAFYQLYNFKKDN